MSPSVSSSSRLIRFQVSTARSGNGRPAERAFSLRIPATRFRCRAPSSAMAAGPRRAISAFPSQSRPHESNLCGPLALATARSRSTGRPARGFRPAAYPEAVAGDTRGRRGAAPPSYGPVAPPASLFRKPPWICISTRATLARWISTGSKGICIFPHERADAALAGDRRARSSLSSPCRAAAVALLAAGKLPAATVGHLFHGWAAAERTRDDRDCEYGP
jgi:hypothetical protein